MTSRHEAHNSIDITDPGRSYWSGFAGGPAPSLHPNMFRMALFVTGQHANLHVLESHQESCDL